MSTAVYPGSVIPSSEVKIKFNITGVPQVNSEIVTAKTFNKSYTQKIERLYAIGNRSPIDIAKGYQEYNGTLTLQKSEAVLMYGFLRYAGGIALPGESLRDRLDFNSPSTLNNFLDVPPFDFFVYSGNNLPIRQITGDVITNSIQIQSLIDECTYGSVTSVNESISSDTLETLVTIEMTFAMIKTNSLLP